MRVSAYGSATTDCIDTVDRKFLRLFYQTLSWRLLREARHEELPEHHAPFESDGG